MTDIANSLPRYKERGRWSVKVNVFLALVAISFVGAVLFGAF